MQPEQQQRIMGYFIEEAKDHLNTIEQGLLSLQSTMEDPEMLKEVYRAAHSVKGGAAMLGLNSIQKTAHRLEDCFKVLEQALDESPVKADRQLESLFLRVFDTLEELVEQLQSSFGLTNETASRIMSDAEPVFEELNTHLGQLVKSAESTAFVTAEAPKAAETHRLEEIAPLASKVQATRNETKVLPMSFKRDVLVDLREMLQLFKQQDNPENREALQEHCVRLGRLGEQLDLPGWGELLETARAAIAFPENSYRQLASLVIKEIKQAEELVVAGRSVEISPSTRLKALVPQLSSFDPVTGSDTQEQDIVLISDTHFKTESTAIETTQDNRNTTKNSVSSAINLLNTPDTHNQEDIREDWNEQNFTQDTLETGTRGSWELEQESYQAPAPNPQSQRRSMNRQLGSTNVAAQPTDFSDPEVGMAELNSLADIFEGQAPDLDQTWQEEEIIRLDDRQLAINAEESFSWDDQSNLSDLINDTDNGEASTYEASSSDDLMSWLDDDSPEEVALGSQELTDSLFSDLFLGTTPSTNNSTAVHSGTAEVSDLSDLLLEADSSDVLATEATEAEDLNSLFGDSFFEDSSSWSASDYSDFEGEGFANAKAHNTGDFVLDADAMPELQQQDHDFFAMPTADALTEEDERGLEKVDLSSEHLINPESLDIFSDGFTGDENESLALEDSLPWELEDLGSDESWSQETSLTEPELDLKELLEIADSDREPIPSLDAAMTQDNVAFGEELGILDESFLDTSTNAINQSERLTEWDLEDFLSLNDLNQSEALEWDEESEIVLDASAIDLDWDATLDPVAVGDLADFEIEPESIDSLSDRVQPSPTDRPADKEPNGFGTLTGSPFGDATRSSQKEVPFGQSPDGDGHENGEIAPEELASVWDFSNPFEENSVEESLWQLDEPEFVLDETDSTGIEANTLDFDLDTTSTSPFNVDQENDGDMDDWFDKEALSSAEASEEAGFNSLENLDDWFGSQTAPDALGADNIELESVEASQWADFNSLENVDDLFGSQTAPDALGADSIELESVEASQWAGFNSLENVDDLFGSQTAPDALAAQSIELESLAESEAIHDVDTLDDFLDIDLQASDTSGVDSPLEFEEFSLFQTSDDTSGVDSPLEFEEFSLFQTSEATDDSEFGVSSNLQASDWESLWSNETSGDIDALDFSLVDLDTLNVDEDFFASQVSSQELDFEAEDEATVDAQAALFDAEAAEAPAASDRTASTSFQASALSSPEASDLEALFSSETSGDIDALAVSEENLFETEMAADGEVESPETEAVGDFLDWEGASLLEADNLEELFGAQADNVTDAQDWDEMLKAAEGSSEEWDFETEGDATAAALELDGETADSDIFSELAPLELTSSSRQMSEFDELESMLAENLVPASSEELTSSSRQMPEFDELEAMLAEDSAPAAAFESVDTNIFDDLEFLLSEETPAAAVPSPAPVNKEAVKANATEDEFADLNLLLEQAEAMGGPSTATPASSARPAMRRPPRGPEPTMRVPVKHLDSLSNLVGELVVNRNSLEQDQERLRQFLDNLSHQVLALSDVGSRMQDLYERSLLESSLLASRQNYRHSLDSTSPTQSTHSSGIEYDPLEMDRFTGFHLLSQEMIELIVRVRESASDIEFLVDETDQVARMLRQVTTQLQEGLTRGRMVPFAQMADRLFRAVREVSLQLGKEAQLHVEGRETLIDKMILENLYDPMTHLVNNALTHGIESPDVRSSLGKSAVGQIILRASQQGNQTVISISDDGAGINPERVRAKAIEKKLIPAAKAKTLTNLDLYDFLFHPGFTTKDKEDEYSGRGVGMDVVRTSLSEIRGTIHIDSTLGKGTTFTIRLPLTLSICKALCCLSDKARIAFPMDGVEDMLDLPGDRVQTNSAGQPCIQWRDTLLPFQPLSELLTYNRQLSRATVYGGKREDDMISIVVLRSTGNFIAIQVDQVLGEQEIVIKQLEGPAPKPVGIAGATVLGDGRIMPIADVLELIDLSMGRIRKNSSGTLWSREETRSEVPPEIPETKPEPMVLIVDDSITVRELLSMTFTKAGYRVEQARDGQEAWEKLRSGLPCDIVFCDIEMPRMDGLELLSRLQKDDTLNDLPIAMLTSRGADRHRQMAAQLGASGYFTKPYLEEVLLEAAQRMIKGEVLFGSSSNA